MRRSICYCEPAQTKAGTCGTWKFIHTTAQTIPKNALVRFDLESHGRDIDWEVPSVHLKKDTNVIFLELDDGTIVTAKEIEVPNSFIPQFEFKIPQEIHTGESFAIVVGAKDEKGAARGEGNRCQTSLQRRRPFSLYIDPTGKQRFSEPEIFHMDIQGNKLEHIRILTPSLVGKNKRFDIVVRFEDKYGNLTSDAPDETLMELSYEQLRENLNWKIFVPETGFITLPNLYFNEAGVYTIQLKNLSSGQVWKSAPIRCSEDSNHLLLWGLLHGESDKVDSTENIDTCLRHFRDDKSLNFFSLSPFESLEETSNETWKACVQTLQEFNEDDRFTTFAGFQWVGEAKKEGMRHLIYLKDQKQLIRKKDAKGATLEKLYKSFSPKEALSIPLFTMGKKYEFNFKQFNPEFERVVEIYNSWGSSEMPKSQGNATPIHTEGKGGVDESSEGSLVDALNRNCRFGFVAGGLDDRGVFDPLYDAKQSQYSPGMTAILSENHSKASIGEALYQRRCYATTGERIVIEFFIANEVMGSELKTGEKPGLLVNRHLSGFVAGTDSIESIEIIRNGELLHTLHPEGYYFDFTYDDMTPLDGVTIHPKEAPNPYVYYYLRVHLKNGHMAWSSPIWIDVTKKEVPAKKGKIEAKRSKPL